MTFSLVALLIISLALATGFYAYNWDKYTKALVEKHNKTIVPIISSCLNTLVSDAGGINNEDDIRSILKTLQLLTGGY